MWSLVYLLIRTLVALIVGTSRRDRDELSAKSPARTPVFAERTNSLPKYVASRTLEGPLDWNASLI